MILPPMILPIYFSANPSLFSPLFIFREGFDRFPAARKQKSEFINHKFSLASGIENGQYGIMQVLERRVKWLICNGLSAGSQVPVPTGTSGVRNYSKIVEKSVDTYPSI